jgi:hypothetical protein
VAARRVGGDRATWSPLEDPSAGGGTEEARLRSDGQVWQAPPSTLEPEKRDKQKGEDAHRSATMFPEPKTIVRSCY